MMNNDTIDDLYLNENNFIVNGFDVSKTEDFLAIKTLKPKVFSYIWVVLGCFLGGSFFLFLTLYYFISEGGSLFLLFPLFMALFCFLPGALVLYVCITHKEKWFFSSNEIEHISQYGEKSITPKNEVSSIFIVEERRNTYGNIHSLISIHLKFKNKKTRELIRLDNSKKRGEEDALILSQLISEFWEVSIKK